jgi:hypothetical protein
MFLGTLSTTEDSFELLRGPITWALSKRGVLGFGIPHLLGAYSIDPHSRLLLLGDFHSHIQAEPIAWSLDIPYSHRYIPHQAEFGHLCLHSNGIDYPRKDLFVTYSVMWLCAPCTPSPTAHRSLH